MDKQKSESSLRDAPSAQETTRQILKRLRAEMPAYEFRSDPWCIYRRTKGTNAPWKVHQNLFERAKSGGAL